MNIFDLLKEVLLSIFIIIFKLLRQRLQFDLIFKTKRKILCSNKQYVNPSCFLYLVHKYIISDTKYSFLFIFIKIFNVDGQDID